MDIGVSLIITASGLVMSKYLHGPSKLKFRRLLKSSAPLFIFGIIKAVVSAKFKLGADEYGKHWNFFINLALIPFTLILANFLPSLHLIPLICLIWMLGK
jgi:glucosaminylphosphatidylinositol acyltransferase